MEMFCIPSAVYDFLLFLAFTGLCILLGVCIAGAIASANAPSKSDWYAAQIHAQGQQTRATVQKLTDNHISKMAQTSEELRRKRKMRAS